LEKTDMALPEHADFVIIGAAIHGVSTARKCAEGLNKYNGADVAEDRTIAFATNQNWSYP
jgi:glycine/D-amino acid oxidase-like deaminating enzyme